MKNWMEKYQSKLRNLDDAINKIESTQNVFLSSYCNEPQLLVEELVRQKKRIKGISLYINVAGSPLQYAQKECYGFFNIRAFLSSVGLLGIVKSSDFDYIPLNLSNIPDYLKNKKIDVALIQVSPPNKKGFCNLGISVDYTKSLIKEAEIVIAEVNPNLPKTYGDTMVHIDEVDCFVQSSKSVLELKERELSNIERKIGEHVASLIPDGSTIQWGIGGIPNSVLKELSNKKDLGVHSGSITEPIINLMENKVITNQYKSYKKGKVICTTVLGNKKLYDYINENPMIELHPVDVTHNVNVIQQIDNFHAINSAIEVDVYGQINAETINGNIIAGVGGQMDFIKGARLSDGGKSIIALTSTTPDFKKSKIKVVIDSVTSIKSEIDYIVTEYGIAELFNKSLKERAEAIISIAHPKFREALKRELGLNE